ncbi:MAG: DHH family phosphoesterase [bacterium]|nr:DHH family phosphoesterase [bacterium]
MEKFKSIASLLLQSRETIHIIVAQVDPDALGCAVGVMSILDHIADEVELEPRIQIVYAGDVAHPQNRAIMTKCDLAKVMVHISSVDIERLTNCILVDSSEMKDSRISAKHRIHPVIIIDHHRSSLPDEDDSHFFWVDEVGAASTLVFELVEAINVEFSANTALLLALGIYTDTKRLVGASVRDRYAYGRVTSEVVASDMNLLIEYVLPRSHFDHLASVLSTMQIHGEKLVANAGHLRPDEGDDLALIADELLRMSGITMVVVWGIIDSAVRVSARNTDLGTPLDTFLKERFGQDSAGAKITPDGRGEGGAHLSLDLGFWLTDKTRPEAEALAAARIKELVFET